MSTLIVSYDFTGLNGGQPSNWALDGSGSIQANKYKMTATRGSGAPWQPCTNSGITDGDVADVSGEVDVEVLTANMLRGGIRMKTAQADGTDRGYGMYLSKDSPSSNLVGLHWGNGSTTSGTTLGIAIPLGTYHLKVRKKGLVLYGRLQRALDGKWLDTLAIWRNGERDCIKYTMSSESGANLYRGVGLRGYGTGNSATFDNLTYYTSDALVPLPPTDLVATGISGVRIDTSWSISSLEQTGQVLEYSTSPLLTSPTTVSLGPTDTSSIVTGLTPGTTYYFRVKGTNAAGSSDYTPIVSASTFALPSLQVSAAFVITSGTEYNFGNINRAQTTELVLNLDNVGSGTLVLDTLSRTGDTTIKSGTNPSGNSGNNQTVTIVLDTSTAGDKVGTLSIPSNAFGSPFQMSFIASILSEPVMTLTRLPATSVTTGTTIALGSVNQDANTIVQFSIGNSGQQTLVIGDVTGSDDVHILPSADPSGQSGTGLSLTAVIDTSTAGSKTGTVTIPSNGTNTPFTVSFTATILAPPQLIVQDNASPASEFVSGDTYEFGNIIEVETPVEIDLLVVNTGEQDLVINSVIVDGSITLTDDSVSGATIASDNSESLTVVLDSSTIGGKSGTITITSNSPNSPFTQTFLGGVIPHPEDLPPDLPPDPEDFEYLVCRGLRIRSVRGWDKGRLLVKYLYRGERFIYVASEGRKIHLKDLTFTDLWITQHDFRVYFVPVPVHPFVG